MLVERLGRRAGQRGRELPLRPPGARRRRAAAGPGRVRDARRRARRGRRRDRLLDPHPRADRGRATSSARTPASARPFQLRGTVAHGDKRGRTLGFPTANLVPDPALVVPGPRGLRLPRRGRARRGWRSWPAATSVGVRPTFVTGRGLLVEAFLLGFDGDLYGRELRLEFLVAPARRAALRLASRSWSTRWRRDVEETRRISRPDRLLPCCVAHDA